MRELGVEDVSDSMPTILWEAKLGFVLSLVVSSFHHRSHVDRANDQNSVDLTIYVPWIYTHGLSRKQNRVVWNLSCFVHPTVYSVKLGEWHSPCPQDRPRESLCSRLNRTRDHDRPLIAAHKYNIHLIT